MNEILTIITFLALLFYTGLELKFQLQMMQQNSYRNDRYNRWLKGESFASVSRLIDLFLLLLLSTNFLPAFIQIVTITVVVAKSVRLLKAKYKKPLVFTRRATRLYLAAALLTLLITGFAACTTSLANGCRTLLAIEILAPYLMIAANWLMRPVENRINKKYYTEAKQILAQMPGLTIIGITGSYGKTSTKHYLYRILCEKYNVLMTPGSFNTPMGVIRTIREQMKPYHNITSRLPRVSLLRVNLTRSVSLTLRTALNAQAGAKAESIRSRSTRSRCLKTKSAIPLGTIPSPSVQTHS